MAEFDILVVGDANPDLILRGDVRPRFGQAEQLLTAADLVLGGSAAITAAGCARLGLRTALLAAVGDDVFGAVTREHLESRGVRLHAVKSADQPTGLSVILSEPDNRAILTLPGTIPALHPEDVTDDLLRRARHVHVSSLYLQPALAGGLAAVFARARTLGLTTSLDTNWDPAERWASIAEILQHTDVFLPNANELLAITGESTPDAAAARLGAAGQSSAGQPPAGQSSAGQSSAGQSPAGQSPAGPPLTGPPSGRLSGTGLSGTGLSGTGMTVVMKDGVRGGRAWWPGGTAAAPGRAVEVVDTTGAGDSFNAGFLAARLAGRPIPEAVAWAAVSGSLSTRAAGGTAAQATPADLP
jgi:ribokinase